MLWLHCHINIYEIWQASLGTKEEFIHFIVETNQEKPKSNIRVLFIMDILTKIVVEREQLTK